MEEPEKSYKERKDMADCFDVIKNKVKYKGNIGDVLIKIRNTKNGKKTNKDFYIIKDKEKD